MSTFGLWIALFLPAFGLGLGLLSLRDMARDCARTLRGKP